MLHKTHRLGSLLFVMGFLLVAGARSEAGLIIHAPEGLHVGETSRIVFVTPGTHITHVLRASRNTIRS